MTSIVTFQNKGLLSLDLLQTFGASVKKGGNPIGYFGTGLKYAIAILLRNGCKIQLLRGSKGYKFSLKTKTIRGKKLQFVMMNQKQLGFTSELGRNWEPWMAYRELYSNCMDEPESSIVQGDPPRHFNGLTSIIVTCPTGNTAKYKPEDIYVQTEPLFATDDCEIHTNTSGYIFYKGIRVDSFNDIKYSYNLLNDLELTEDRTVSCSWEVRDYVREVLIKCDNINLIRDCITRDAQEAPAYEFGNTYPHWIKPSDAFQQATLEAVRTAKALTNESAIKVCMPYQSELHPVAVPLNDIQEQQLAKAKGILHKMSANVDDYPIIFAEELGKGVLGLAERKPDKIFISMKCFDLGTKFLTATLYEEYIHIRHNVNDQSRAMQNFLFDKLFSYVETYVLKEPI